MAIFPRRPSLARTGYLVSLILSLVVVGFLAAPRAAAKGHKRAHHLASFLGKWGVEASWVLAENRRPGTTAWRIANPALSADISGYASTQQVEVGQTVRLYVSTAAKTFRVQAFRMGYYQGKGARLIWTSPLQKGTLQPTCPVVPKIYMVQCNWRPSVTFKVTKRWVQGAYLLKLEGSGGQQSYVPLVVWDPSSTATYVIMEGVLTWQAFNPYGGYDLYEGQPPGLSGYPYPTRSRIVSFDRPYGYGEGAADFLSNEYPLIYFAEEHGLDVTYWTDITLATHGNLLLRHKVLISLGHDEEWSESMRNWATEARDKGVNLIFFGASPILRKVRLEPSPIGPDMEMVNYRDPTADPLYGKDPSEVTQNWWGQPPANDPASTLVGASYDGFNNNEHFPMVVVDASAWLFKGTGLHNGSEIPGVLFTDFDAYDPQKPNPPDVEILTHSKVIFSFDGSSGWADTTYYTWRPSESGVFESGTNNWIPAMGQPCPKATSGAISCPALLLQKMTGNLLWLFGQGPSGRLEPSRPNWSQFYG